MTGRVWDWISRMKNWRLSRNTPNTNTGLLSSENNIVRALGHFEPYVMKAQSILVWENPIFSVLFIIVVNILFGLAVSFEIRFYSLIFTFLLCFFIIDLWLEKIWPQMTVMNRPLSTTQQKGHSRILTFPEISCYISRSRDVLKDYYVWLKNLRDDQPGTFCCAMCMLFALLTFIGRTVPGAVIGYCLLMLVMTGPGIYIHILPNSFKLHLSRFQSALHSKDKGILDVIREHYLAIIQCFLAGEIDSEVEEYLLEQSCETLAVLQQATEPMDEEQREESLIAEDFGLDMETADLSIHGREDGSIDGLDISEFDLSPLPSLSGSVTNSISNNHQFLAQPSIRGVDQHRKHDDIVDDSDDSDDIDNVKDGIHFQSHHFYQDSSEEEEQAFVHGLVFPEPPNSGTVTVGTSQNPMQTASPSIGQMLTTTAVNAVSKNISNLATLHSSLISSVINAAVEKVSGQHATQELFPNKQKGSREINRDDSSSSGGESEFEMISHNDLT